MTRYLEFLVYIRRQACHPDLPLSAGLVAVAAQTYPCRWGSSPAEEIGRESMKRTAKGRGAGGCLCTRTCLQENRNT